MKTKIFNLIILDESGSMQCIKTAAVNSVNETIQTIRAAEKKHEDQEHYVSFVTFNNDVKTICDCVPVADVRELSEENYSPDCCTALYDAMGMSVNALRKKIGKEDKVLVTVVTDGEENASREYSGKAVKSLIDEMKSAGWVFAYIGANHDVEAAAGDISITNVMRFETTTAGVASMGTKLVNARIRFFDKIASHDFDVCSANEDFFDEDDE